MSFAPTILKGQLVRPEAVSADQRLPDTPLTQGSGDPFTIAFYHTWSFVEGEETDEGGEWLPDYREIRHVSGANGCTDAGRGRVNAAPAINGAVGKGAIVIRNNDPRMGPYASYLARHIRRTDKRGGSPFVYCLAPVEWALISNGTEAVPTHTLETKRWIVGFRRQMYLSGLIPPMARQQLDTHLHRVSQRVQRWTDALERGHLTQPAYDSRVREAQRLTAAMTSAWDRQFRSGYDDQIEAAPTVSAQPVTLPTFAGDEPPALQPELTPTDASPMEPDAKSKAMARVGVAEATHSAEQIAEVKEALGINPETPISRFGADRLTEYADALERI